MKNLDFCERLRERAGAGETRRQALPAHFHLGDRPRHQLDHGAADLMVGLGNALVVEITPDFLEDAAFACVIERGQDHLLGVGVGLRSRQSQFLRGPNAEHPVAPRSGLEPQLFVMRELLLESFLALVERGHACLAGCGNCGHGCTRPFAPGPNESSAAASSMSAKVSYSPQCPALLASLACITGHYGQSNCARTDSLQLCNGYGRDCAGRRDRLTWQSWNASHNVLGHRASPSPRSSHPTGATAQRWTFTNHGTLR